MAGPVPATHARLMAPEYRDGDAATSQKDSVSAGTSPAMTIRKT
jgi:hypothetical protein